MGQIYHCFLPLEDRKKANGLPVNCKLWELAGTLWFHLSSPSSFSPPLVPAEAPPTPGLTDVPGKDGVILTHGFLFALHRAEEGALHGHEALAHQTLGAAGAPEAVRLGVPVMVAVWNPLGFRLHRLLARRAFLQSGKTEYSQCKWLNVVFHFLFFFFLKDSLLFIQTQTINSEVFKDVKVQSYFTGWPQLTKM